MAYEKLYFELSNELSNKAKTMHKQHLKSSMTIKQKDWDDALRDTEVFDSKNYASDSPDGYMSAVDEVVEERDLINVKKRESEKKLNDQREKEKAEAKIKYENEKK